MHLSGLFILGNVLPVWVFFFVGIYYSIINEVMISKSTDNNSVSILSNIYFCIVFLFFSKANNILRISFLYNNILRLTEMFPGIKIRIHCLQVFDTSVFTSIYDYSAMSPRLTMKKNHFASN